MQVKRLVQENKIPDHEISALLKKHWKIALITKKQAREIDSKYKHTMPSGWAFENGDTLQRLTEYGIGNLVPYVPPPMILL